MPIDEKKIAKLKKKQAQGIKRLASLLIGIYDKYNIKIGRAKTTEMLLALANSNIFNTKEALPIMEEYNTLIQQMFMAGIKYQGGASSPINTQYSEVLSDTASSFVSKLGETLKQDMLTTIQKGTIDEAKSFNDIRQDVQTLMGNKTYEATRIVRTETMRASNSAAYIQAKTDGKGFFTVDNRDEACELCVDEYEGQVFTMDQTDMLPPLHPNCACVAEFHMSEEGAQEWADELQGLNEDARSGDEQPSDGAGAWEGRQYGDGEVVVTVTRDEEEGGE